MFDDEFKFPRGVVVVSGCFAFEICDVVDGDVFVDLCLNFWVG